MSAVLFAFSGPHQPQGTLIGTPSALRSKGIFVGILATDASSNSEVCVREAIGGWGSLNTCHFPLKLLMLGNLS